MNDRYRGVFRGRRVVFLNEEDIRKAGWQQGQMVDLTSHFHGEERIARHFMIAPSPIPRQCAATYFPEANVLVPINSTAERSNTPTSKSVIITIAPSPDAETAAAELLNTLRDSAPNRSAHPAAGLSPKLDPMSFLDRQNIVAGPGYNRWLVPPAALAVHLAIGQVYAFSVSSCA